MFVCIGVFWFLLFGIVCGCWLGLFALSVLWVCFDWFFVGGCARSFVVCCLDC